MERNKSPEHPVEDVIVEVVNYSSDKTTIRTIHRRSYARDLNHIYPNYIQQATVITAKSVAAAEQVFQKRKKNKVAVAPGFTLLKLLRIVCAKNFVERVLTQIHADAIIELYEAEKNGEKLLAFAIPWRLRMHLLSATLAGLMGGFLSKFRFGITNSKE